MNFFFTTILIAIISCAHAAYIPPGPGDPSKAVLEAKCRKNAHNDETFKDLTNSVEPLRQCLKDALGFPPPNPITDHGSFCEQVRGPDYYICIDNFVKKVSPCLDEDEAYLPEFVLTAFNASLDSTCGKNGRNRITAMINDVSTSTCLTSHLSLEAILSICTNNLIIYKNLKNDVHTIRKNDLCSDLRSLKGCVIQTLQEFCYEDHNETIGMLIDPYLVTC